MGGAKREMEEGQEKLTRALLIAAQAGVVVACGVHEEVYLEGNEDIESAYKLGNKLFSRGELNGIFESRREMTDLIQEAVSENSATECSRCAVWRDE